MTKKKILTYKGAVTTLECDSNRHMNVVYYMSKYELAGRNFSVELGISKAYLKANNYGIAVVEQTITYQKEVFEDDILYIESTVENFSNKVLTLKHILKDGATHAIAGSMIAKTVILDRLKRKAVVIPTEIKEKLSEFM